MKVFVVVALVVGTASAYGFESNPALLQKYYKGNFTFDGNKVTGNQSGVNFNNKERWVTSKTDTNQYHMQWGTEKAGNDEILTVSESMLTKDGSATGSVYTRTSSFYQDKLRASTVCYGNGPSDKGFKKSELKCVTATRRACERLLSSYKAESKENKNLAKNPTGKAFKETLQEAEKCATYMGSFSNMAKAFGNQSSQVEKRQAEVVDQDIARLKNHLSKSVKSGSLALTSLSSLSTAEELADNAKNFSTSMEGIRALSAALQTCAESADDFRAESSGSSGGQPSATGSSR